MSQRFLPMIRHLESRGLIWSQRAGAKSPDRRVAAKVRIDAIKANEASPDVLDGPPVTIPRLLLALRDPLAYDLTAMRSGMRLSSDGNSGVPPPCATGVHQFRYGQCRAPRPVSKR